MSIAEITAAIRDVPDFPKPGIVFKDISPLIQSPRLLRLVTDEFAALHQGQRIDVIAAVDARGFVFGGALAHHLGIGLAMIRKAGKLPYRCVSASYELEYGSATIEMQVDSVKKGDQVLIVDDVLATGGTARAASDLVEQLGAEVLALDFLMELTFLPGRNKLAGYRVNSLVAVGS